MLGLSVLLEDLRSSGERADHPEQGIRKVIEEVVIPEIEQNFMSGGRPPWELLQDTTVTIKSRLGFGLEPLIATGNLLEEATSISNWDIADDEASLVLGSADYGYYHEFGTRNMPARPFMTISEDTLAQMEEVLNEWVVTGK